VAAYIEELQEKYSSSTVKQHLACIRMMSPGTLKEFQPPDGTTVKDCIYTPHSLRATTATLLLDADVDIRKVQDPLGHHRHHADLRPFESEGSHGS